MSKTVFDVLEEKFVELSRSYEVDLASGAAASYDKYKEMCGVIRGLALALREVEDLARHYRENDDDE
jgi:major membrane immunogen (membrane-anchored lipoprotein)